MENIIKNFQISGSVIKIEPYANGLVNKTYLVETTTNKYIMQKINHHVFKKPDILMNNIEKVTSYLEKCQEPTMKIIKTLDDNNYYFDGESYYRAYTYLDWGESYSMVENYSQFLECGKVIGRFQENFALYPMAFLSETINDFHDTPKRFNALMHTIIQNRHSNRTIESMPLIKYLFEHYDDICTIQHLVDKGKIPKRVVHNDTKLNNVMFYKNNAKAACLVDLDTVMPGVSLFDYGDALRIGASTHEEDEIDNEKIDFDLKLFSVFTVGYLSSATHFLNCYEINNLEKAIEVITLECACRFLTDYLNNDKYFLTKYDKHNYDRAKAQISLHKKIHEKEKIIKKIINNITIRMNDNQIIELSCLLN